MTVTVAEAIETLEREIALGNLWFRTHEKMMRTYEIIEELSKIDQNLLVLRFEFQDRGLVPDIYVLIEGRVNT